MKPCGWHITEADKLGYVQWHAKAAESHRKGMRQIKCAGCGLWFFPWERVDGERGGA